LLLVNAIVSIISNHKLKY